MRSWYSANINEFASASTDEIIGCLLQSSVNDGFNAERAQVDAWREGLALLTNMKKSGITVFMGLEYK